MSFNRIITSLTALLGVTALVSCSKPASQILQTPSAAIIGGTQANSGDMVSKSTVAILITISDQNDQGGQYLCTGTLIRDNLILTAAHCAPKSDQKHYVRSYVVFSNDLENLADRDVRLVIDQEIHPRFGKNQGPHGEDANDLAVIRYGGALPAGYRPARFLPADSVIRQGAKATVAGYGLTSGAAAESDGHLYSTDVTIGENFGDTEVLVDQSNGKGACHGDSGGPVFVSLKGVNYLWGVVSRGAGAEDDCLSSGIYTKINAQLDFINPAIVKLSNRN